VFLATEKVLVKIFLFPTKDDVRGTREEHCQKIFVSGEWHQHEHVVFSSSLFFPPFFWGGGVELM